MYIHCLCSVLLLSYYCPLQDQQDTYREGREQVGVNHIFLGDIKQDNAVSLSVRVCVRACVCGWIGEH